MDKNEMYEAPEIIFEGDLEVTCGTPRPKLPEVPDLDPNDSASLQRIFELGLMALAAQVGANLGREEVLTQDTEPC